ALALSFLAAGAERRLDNAPEFPLGLLVGMGTVLATTALNALVLLWGGAEDWHTIVLLVFVAHLPIAVIEGVVLGFTVGFLARVKPEMLGGPDVRAKWRRVVPAAPSAPGIAVLNPATEVVPAPGLTSDQPPFRPPALLLAALAALLAATPA